MSPQIVRTMVLVAALACSGLAQAQPTPVPSSSGGPTPATDKSGGPTPATDKSGGPTPALDKSGGPAPAAPNVAGPTPVKPAQGAAKSLSPGERRFLEDAAKGGLAEVELGRIAQQKAQGAPVKDFAARMVADHGKANEELKRLAGAKGVTLPAALDRAHKGHADDLEKTPAEKFDRRYMELMVKDHAKDVKEFEKQAKDARDPDVRAFAQKTLPTLQEHLKAARAAP